MIIIIIIIMIMIIIIIEKPLKLSIKNMKNSASELYDWCLQL